MLRLELVQVPDDRSIAATIGVFASGARTGSAAEVDGYRYPGDSVHNLIDHFYGKCCCIIRIGVSGPHEGIDEKTEVRIVDLGNVRAGVADQLEFATQKGNAGAHEVLPLRKGATGFLLSPHPFSEQRG